MSTSISSLSMRTTVPSTTSPCLRLRISPSCSLSSSSIVVGSGRLSMTGSGSGSAAGAASRSSPTEPGDRLRLGDHRLHGLIDGDGLDGIDRRLGGHLLDGSLCCHRLVGRRGNDLLVGGIGDRCRLGRMTSSVASARLAVLEDVTSGLSGALASAAVVGVGLLDGGLALLRFGQVSASPRIGEAPAPGDDRARAARPGFLVRLVVRVAGGLDRLLRSGARAALPSCGQCSCSLPHAIRGASTTYDGRMPELPDLDILADATHAALAGRRIESSSVVQPLVIRGTTAELKALEGQLLQSVRRRGKFLVFQLDRDRIVMNLMLTGRLGMVAPGAKAWPQTVFVMTFGSRAAGPRDAARWTRGATWLPSDDDAVELRDRDATRMGKVYLAPRE